jgi:23S rRNA pseudouridine1911/1915/1917 synthase
LPLLRIIFENNDFLVVDKPPFLIVHPKKATGATTLWHELKHLLAFELLVGGQISFINRLDRETSGLVLVAKNRSSARQLNRLMERNEIRKVYAAIVTGWPEAELFAVNQPLLRQGLVRPSRIWLKQAVHPAGYPSITEFKVLHQFVRKEGRFSVIQAEPKTGRTHQIRVHLSFAGYPIVGDKIYGPDETCYLEFISTGWTPALQRKLLLPRQALHATRLAFTLGQDPFEFSAPLPPDLEDFLRS